MRFELFSKVALRQDFPRHNLRTGDIATVVEHHPVAKGEAGYSLEVFNTAGETIAVFAVGESQISALDSKGVLHVRQMEKAS